MKKIKRFIALVIVFCFIFEQVCFAQSINRFIPGYLQSVLPSEQFRPMHLRSLLLDPGANKFDILLEKGTDSVMSDQQINASAEDLMKYFYIGLILPNSVFWVNLRPGAPDKVMDPLLEKTDIGRVFLESDLQLKKDLARFTSCDTKEGRQYWDKLYDKAESLFGQADVEIPAFTRPWIVPGEIIIGEDARGAYVYKASLKVMLEADYINNLSHSNNSWGEYLTQASYPGGDIPIPKDQSAKFAKINEYSTQLLNQLVIPKLTREVNSSRKYAHLRQAYYSLILAQYFKAKLKSADNNIFSRLIDSKDLASLESSLKWSSKQYFDQYSKSFSQGEYNRQEEVATKSGTTVRNYFSGGIAAILTENVVTFKQDNIPADGLARIELNIPTLGTGPAALSDRSILDDIKRSDALYPGNGSRDGGHNAEVILEVFGDKLTGMFVDVFRAPAGVENYFGADIAASLGTEYSPDDHSFAATRMVYGKAIVSALEALLASNRAVMRNFDNANRGNSTLLDLAEQTHQKWLSGEKEQKEYIAAPYTQSLHDYICSCVDRGMVTSGGRVLTKAEFEDPQKKFKFKIGDFAFASEDEEKAFKTAVLDAFKDSAWAISDMPDFNTVQINTIANDWDALLSIIPQSVSADELEQWRTARASKMYSLQADSVGAVMSGLLTPGFLDVLADASATEQQKTDTLIMMLRAINLGWRLNNSYNWQTFYREALLSKPFDLAENGGIGIDDIRKDALVLAQTLRGLYKHIADNSVVIDEQTARLLKDAFENGGLENRLKEITDKTSLTEAVRRNSVGSLSTVPGSVEDFIKVYAYSEGIAHYIGADVAAFFGTEYDPQARESAMIRIQYGSVLATALETLRSSQRSAMKAFEAANQSNTALLDIAEQTHQKWLAGEKQQKNYLAVPYTQSLHDYICSCIDKGIVTYNNKVLTKAEFENPDLKFKLRIGNFSFASKNDEDGFKTAVIEAFRNAAEDVPTIPDFAAAQINTVANNWDDLLNIAPQSVAADNRAQWKAARGVRMYKLQADSVNAVLGGLFNEDALRVLAQTGASDSAKFDILINILRSINLGWRLNNSYGWQSFYQDALLSKPFDLAETGGIGLDEIRKDAVVLAETLRGLYKHILAGTVVIDAKIAGLLRAAFEKSELDRLLDEITRDVNLRAAVKANSAKPVSYEDLTVKLELARRQFVNDTAVPVIGRDGGLKYAPLTPLALLRAAEEAVEYVNARLPKDLADIRSLYERYFIELDLDVSLSDKEKIWNDVLSIDESRQGRTPYRLKISWTSNNLERLGQVVKNDEESEAYSFATEVVSRFGKEIFPFNDYQTKENEFLSIVPAKVRERARKYLFCAPQNTLYDLYRIEVRSAALSEFYSEPEHTADQRWDNAYPELTPVYEGLLRAFAYKDGDTGIAERVLGKMRNTLESNAIPARYWSVFSDYRIALRYKEFIRFYLSQPSADALSPSEAAKRFIASLGTVRAYRSVILSGRQRDSLIGSDGKIKGGLSAPYFHGRNSKQDIAMLVQKHGLSRLLDVSINRDPSSAPEEMRSRDGAKVVRPYMSVSAIKDASIGIVRGETVLEAKKYGEEYNSLEKRQGKNIFGDIQNRARRYLLEQKIKNEAASNKDKKLYVFTIDVPAIDLIQLGRGSVGLELGNIIRTNNHRLYYQNTVTGARESVDRYDNRVEMLIPEVLAENILNVEEYPVDGPGYSSREYDIPDRSVRTGAGLKDGGNKIEDIKQDLLPALESLAGEMKIYNEEMGKETGFKSFVLVDAQDMLDDLSKELSAGTLASEEYSEAIRWVNGVLSDFKFTAAIDQAQKVKNSMERLIEFSGNVLKSNPARLKFSLDQSVMIKNIREELSELKATDKDEQTSKPQDPLAPVVKPFVVPGIYTDRKYTQDDIVNAVYQNIRDNGFIHKDLSAARAEANSIVAQVQKAGIKDAFFILLLEPQMVHHYKSLIDFYKNDPKAREMSPLELRRAFISYLGKATIFRADLYREGEFRSIVDKAGLMSRFRRGKTKRSAAEKEAKAYLMYGVARLVDATVAEEKLPDRVTGNNGRSEKIFLPVSVVDSNHPEGMEKARMEAEAVARQVATTYARMSLLPPNNDQLGSLLENGGRGLVDIWRGHSIVVIEASVDEYYLVRQAGHSLRRQTDETESDRPSKYMILQLEDGTFAKLDQNNNVNYEAFVTDVPKSQIVSARTFGLSQGAGFIVEGSEAASRNSGLSSEMQMAVGLVNGYSEEKGLTQELDPLKGGIVPSMVNRKYQDAVPAYHDAKFAAIETAYSKELSLKDQIFAFVDHVRDVRVFVPKRLNPKDFSEQEDAQIRKPYLDTLEIRRSELLDHIKAFMPLAPQERIQQVRDAVDFQRNYRDGFYYVAVKDAKDGGNRHDQSAASTQTVSKSDVSFPEFVFDRGAVRMGLIKFFSGDDADRIITAWTTAKIPEHLFILLKEPYMGLRYKSFAAFYGKLNSQDKQLPADKLREKFIEVFGKVTVFRAELFDESKFEDYKANGLRSRFRANIPDAPAQETALFEKYGVNELVRNSIAETPLIGKESGKQGRENKILLSVSVVDERIADKDLAKQRARAVARQVAAAYARATVLDASNTSPTDSQAVIAQYKDKNIVVYESSIDRYFLIEQAMNRDGLGEMLEPEKDWQKKTIILELDNGSFRHNYPDTHELIDQWNDAHFEALVTHIPASQLVSAVTYPLNAGAALPVSEISGNYYASKMDPDLLSIYGYIKWSFDYAQEITPIKPSTMSVLWNNPSFETRVQPQSDRFLDFADLSSAAPKTDIEIARAFVDFARVRKAYFFMEYDYQTDNGVTAEHAMAVYQKWISALYGVSKGDAKRIAKLISVDTVPGIDIGPGYSYRDAYFVPALLADGDINGNRKDGGSKEKRGGIDFRALPLRGIKISGNIAGFNPDVQAIQRLAQGSDIKNPSKSWNLVVDSLKRSDPECFVRLKEYVAVCLINNDRAGLEQATASIRSMLELEEFASINTSKDLIETLVLTRR